MGSVQRREMRLLRDVKEATKILLLREVTTGRHSKLKTLAEAVNITVAGVSDYVKTMTDEGLIQKVGGEFKATKKGVAVMHDGFRELREFVDRSLSEMRIIDATTALAGKDIREGEEVGLVMERGFLTAYPGRESESVGKALRPAEEGSEVPVSDLEGMVSLSPGEVVLIELPSVTEGGSGSVSLDALGEAMDEAAWDVLGVADLTGLGACRRMGVAPDFVFAAVEAAIEAAERGLNVAVLASGDASSMVVSAIEAANTELEDKVGYRVVKPG